MTMKFFAVALLALALTACESSTENTNTSTENKPAATTPAPATPAPPMSSPANASPAPTQLKAGDKVKVMLNGSSNEATIVSVDEKAGKATVKIQGQKEDKTVALSAVTKQ